MAIFPAGRFDRSRSYIAGNLVRRQGAVVNTNVVDKPRAKISPMARLAFPFGNPQRMVVGHKPLDGTIAGKESGCRSSKSRSGPNRK